ncbi:MAG: hypothetical protein R3B49_09905 [Phycisphaerales bacterium]
MPAQNTAIVSAPSHGLPVPPEVITNAYSHPQGTAWSSARS